MLTHKTIDGFPVDSELLSLAIEDYQFIPEGLLSPGSIGGFQKVMLLVSADGRHSAALNGTGSLDRVFTAPPQTIFSINSQFLLAKVHSVGRPNWGYWLLIKRTNGTGMLLPPNAQDLARERRIRNHARAHLVA